MRAQIIADAARMPTILGAWTRKRSGNYQEMGLEAISLLRIATDADRLLGRLTLPQNVSICFENK
jgi:hypothetical protein